MPRIARSDLILAAALALLATGCSTTVTSPPFAPTSSVRGTGALKVGTVRYVPAENSRLRPNQVGTKATVYFEMPIEEYVRKALAAELERSGFTGGAQALLLDAEVFAFGIDTGFIDVEPLLDLKLKLRDGAGVRFEMSYSLKRLHRFATSWSATRADLNAMITEGFEKFLGEPEVRAVLDPTPPATR